MNALEIKAKINEMLAQSPEQKSFIQDLRKSGELYFFGGLIRDLIIGVKPRDFDIVIVKRNDDVFETLKQKYQHKKNSFEGYKFQIDGKEFDVWELQNTWAFKNGLLEASVENLQRSVFLNIDGIVLDDKKQVILSDPFEKFFEKKELDIVLEENPKTELNVLRAFVMKERYKHLFDITFSKRLEEIMETER